MVVGDGGAGTTRITVPRSVHDRGAALEDETTPRRRTRYGPPSHWPRVNQGIMVEGSVDPSRPSSPVGGSPSTGVRRVSGNDARAMPQPKSVQETTDKEDSTAEKRNAPILQVPMERWGCVYRFPALATQD